MKKIISIALALCLLAALAGCGGAASSTPATGAPAGDPAASTPAGSAPSEGGSYTVGICQLVQHDALDAATQGFKDALKEALGDAVTFEEGNASGDASTCTTIVNGFVSDGVDLILANATAPLQAAAAATSDIPVLGTSVTDYATALEITGWTGTVGGNISGTSDLAPLDQQAQMLHDMFPDAEKVGLIYCSGEPNSVYQIDVVEKALQDLGYTCERFAFTDSNDIGSVVQSACDASDVLYVPTDNTAANNTEAIANVVIPAKVPVIAGEEGICGGCGVATLSISYYDIGYTTGQMAARILTGEADISAMPIEYAPQVTKKYNADICQQLGITPPEGYEAIG